MRRLQGEVGLRDTSRKYDGRFRAPENAQVDAATGFGDAAESMLNLSRHLSGETPVTPVRKKPATLPS